MTDHHQNLQADMPTERVQRLRAHAMARLDEVSQPRAEIQLLGARGWMGSAGEPWTIMRRAQESVSILRGMTPVIDADELIVGKTCYRALTAEERAELTFFQQKIAPNRVVMGGQNAHMAIDFDKLLRVGVQGIREEIAEYRSTLVLTDPQDLEKDVFYQTCLMNLDALVEAANHYAELAEAQAETCSNPERAAELRQIAGICRQVPEFPARTFYEAMQCAHFVTFALCCAHQAYLFQYGHPDRYLLPFYRRDLAEGMISPEQAQELIDCLAVMLTEYTPQHLAIGWMLGGRDALGREVSNELTAMFLRSLGHVPLAYPCTGLAWTTNTPLEIKQLAGEMLMRGLSHPAIFNDEVITQGLLHLGLPIEEACLYQQSTCVEITPCAASNVYVASPYINLPQILQDVLGVPSLQGETDYHVADFPASFDALMDAYRVRLEKVIADAVVEQNTLQMTRRYNGGKALLSCFVNDCLARGKDIDHGGARYNWIEPSFVGLANLVDALNAIRQFVYTEGSMDLPKLVEMLRSNFEGCEAQRCQLENRAGKYGNDLDEVDALAQTITGWVAELTHQHKTYLGGNFVSGFFCWIMHEQLGRVTAATADGRKAGFPLGDGSGPAQGRERLGPTAAILSTTKWDHTSHIGGIALNLKFTPPRQKDLFNARLLDLIDSYVARGGFEVQVNVVDRQKLEAARKHPQEYQDLVVRIGGYSDYFVRLSPEMQEEVILRTEHEEM